MKENVFELLREWKGYVHTTDTVYGNEDVFYHDRTLYNRIRYEKEERTIAKCGHKNKGTIKNHLCLRRRQCLSPIHAISIIKNNKKILRSWLRDTDIQLSMFKEN